LFHHINDAVIVGNAATERIVLWNDAATRIFGYTEAEARQLFLHVLVPDELVAYHRAGLARYQATGAGSLVDGKTPVALTAMHKEGHNISIELTLTPLEDLAPNGDRFALAVVRDTTDRRSAEEAQRKLAQVEERRRQAFDLNETIVQGLAIAKMALESENVEHAFRVVSDTLDKAKSVVRELIGEIKGETPLRPGDLRVEDHEGD